jgi:hypothetical protein
MPADRREQIQQSLRKLVESYRFMMDLMERTLTLLTDLGRPWSRGTVHQVLTNEKYIGNNVYNRTSFKLKKKHVKNTPEMWVRADGAFDAVVSPEAFFTARGIFQERARRLSDEVMLARLRELGRQNQTISGQVIDAAEAMPTSAAYRSRFGSLINAYRQAGLEVPRDYRYVEINRGLRALHPGLVGEVVRRLGEVGAKVSRLSAIQEHFMILRAIKNGVAESRIARALNIDVASIRQKRDLLEGICPEAVQRLKDRPAPGQALREMRRVKPMRQIEIAELMCAAGNFSVGYARCLVTATPEEQLIDGNHGHAAKGLSPEDIARMEHEMESLGREFKLIEESHGKNTLNLVIVAAYLRKLLENTRVTRYLAQNHAEIHTEFQKLVESRSLAEGAPEQLHAE